MVVGVEERECKVGEWTVSYTVAIADGFRGSRIAITSETGGVRENRRIGKGLPRWC